MNSETNNLFANRYMGLSTYEDLVDWAISCLEANLDSKNIRILASMRTSLYPSEVEFYFKRCLQDLGWTIPDQRECLLNYTRYIAEQIVSGDLPPAAGAVKMHHLSTELGHPRELSAWCYLDEESDEEIRNEAARFLNEV